MSIKVLTIVSGAPSGALNIAMTIASYFGKFYDSRVIFRKYNKANIKNVNVIKDMFVLDYIYNLYQEIKKNKPDMIVVHGYSTHLWTKIAVAFQKVPLIHVEHNVEKYTFFRRFLLQILDKYTKTYICVSHGVARHLINQGIDERKVTVIYNGIDIEKFKIKKMKQEKFTIGMTARFSGQKDQMTLIKAIEILLLEKKITVQLILQGDGKTKMKCMDYVRANGLSENVLFETGKFVDLATKIDLFVLSTHYEGLPLVLCETMAAKIPTIATDVPGVDEIIAHGKDGFLVAHDNCRSLAEQIEFCFTNRQSLVMSEIVDNAFSTVNEKFTLSKMCEQYKQSINDK